MSIHEDSDSAFDRLPRFDARDFEPPAWAKGPQFQWGKKNGESSTSAHRQRQNPAGDHHVEDDGDEEDGEEEWVDASEGRSEVDPNLATFTTGELKVSSMSIGRN
jgi:hypothetical protein